MDTKDKAIKEAIASLKLDNLKVSKETIYRIKTQGKVLKLIRKKDNNERR